MLNEEFMSNPSGLEHCRKLAARVDDIIRNAVLNNGVPNSNIAVVATGGYGRGVLCPYSDIDLLFLYAGGEGQAKEYCENIIYALWDAKLKVSHSFRTISDTRKFAAEDINFKTSLITMRYICGQKELYTNLEHKFWDSRSEKDIGKFLLDKLDELDRRHQVMGDSRYFLEPNIKEGKGGLRDLDTIYWLARYVYRIDNLKELEKTGLVGRREIRQFTETYDFLLKVRNMLHYVAGRAEERLLFDHQLSMAPRLGFNDTEVQKGAERFMKRYFNYTAVVGALVRVFCAMLEEKNLKRKPAVTSLPESKDYILKNDRLTFAPQLVVTATHIVHIFRIACEHTLEIHPEALKITTSSLKLLNRKSMTMSEIREDFFAILLSRVNSVQTLRLMNDFGVLGRIIPEFALLKGAMQYDLYHVYTVDEHTLHAVGIIHDIENQKLVNQHPVSSELIGRIVSRRALYMAMLLHDIAKGRGGNHNVLGGKIATAICMRMGMDKYESRTVAWLVENHLLMTSTVFKRDIYDESTITNFVAEVRSPEILKMLMIITVADIKAVGPAIWNEYKAGLLRALYSQAEAAISGYSPSTLKMQILDSYLEQTRKALVHHDQSKVQEYLSLLTEDFVLYFPPEKQERLFSIYSEYMSSGLDVKVSNRPDFNHEITELTVLARDRKGLFATIAGVISLCGGSILIARAFTLKNGVVIDHFIMQDVATRAYMKAEKVARISANLNMALEGELDIAEKLGSESRGVFRRTSNKVKIPAVVKVDATSNPDFTIVEVNAEDKPALLYSIAKRIADMGVNTASAFISTYGTMVVDVFYLNNPTLDSEQIRQSIADCI